MKKYIIIAILTIIGILASSVYFLYQNNKTLREELSISKTNEKAFIAENSILKKENKVFKFTIEQLDYYNDSILEKMNNVRKELEIKDKDLKQMQYLLSNASKIDTVVFRDTIFKDIALDLDTTIGNKWYNIRLNLKYPNTIITNPKFNSEKYVIVNYKKETIAPPKKCKILRFFQKKHKVVEVSIVEKSPYIINEKQRFVEIIE